MSKFEKMGCHSVDENIGGGEGMELCKRKITRWISMENTDRKKEKQKRYGKKVGESSGMDRGKKRRKKEGKKTMMGEGDFNARTGRKRGRKKEENEAEEEEKRKSIDKKKNKDEIKLVEFIREKG